MAARMSNESALTRMTDSTPNNLGQTWRWSWMDELTQICQMKDLPSGWFHHVHAGVVGIGLCIIGSFSVFLYKLVFHNYLLGNFVWRWLISFCMILLWNQLSMNFYIHYIFLIMTFTSYLLYNNIQIDWYICTPLGCTIRFVIEYR